MWWHFMCEHGGSACACRYSANGGGNGKHKCNVHAHTHNRRKRRKRRNIKWLHSTSPLPLLHYACVCTCCSHYLCACHHGGEYGRYEAASQGCELLALSTHPPAPPS